jgi:hypothetical protein
MKEQIPRKEVIKWLHIATSMLNKTIKRDIEELSILNHQIENFNEMDKRYQDNVIDDLNILLERLEPNYVEVLK